jgi:hypothetical protein
MQQYRDIIDASVIYALDIGLVVANAGMGEPNKILDNSDEFW